MPFVRVRGAGPKDPPHEFDAPVGVVEADPELYVVLDPEPVPEPRPPLYGEPAESAAKQKSAGPTSKTKPVEPAYQKEG